MVISFSSFKKYWKLYIENSTKITPRPWAFGVSSVEHSEPKGKLQIENWKLCCLLLILTLIPRLLVASYLPAPTCVVGQAGWLLLFERETGFAPATSSLARKRSTTELFPQFFDSKLCVLRFRPICSSNNKFSKVIYLNQDTKKEAWVILELDPLCFLDSNLPINLWNKPGLFEKASREK